MQRSSVLDKQPAGFYKQPAGKYGLIKISVERGFKLAIEAVQLRFRKRISSGESKEA